ncbi:transcription initiation factor TFIID subunit 1-like isoform X1 [Rhododendron vialii]|uniref:transcription initiation factor TFIID subunit 1-like isoform X1 n=1 Tax=Rhododendron vialii TaxID=182163 RepID=UPI00265E9C30|nr:transcription initiation factor TFIID subunit 1-like isoform X1 [Rhododendron vialii]
MGYESDDTSQDGRGEDDEDDYEEAGGGNRLLGFMFGNVDGSGDLGVDYLDELSVKSSRTPVDAAEKVISHAYYDEKAEDAVDYEDIDEQ